MGTGGGSARTAPERVLLFAAFGAFLAFLDATVVNVAFPDIRESFPDASIGDLSWVLNAYNIVFASFLVVFGRLTDLLGRRRMFVLGTFVFTVASGLCAAAPSLELLVAARVLQALGAALLVPASLAVVVEAFTAHGGVAPEAAGGGHAGRHGADARRDARLGTEGVTRCESSTGRSGWQSGWWPPAAGPRTTEGVRSQHRPLEVGS